MADGKTVPVDTTVSGRMRLAVVDRQVRPTGFLHLAPGLHRDQPLFVCQLSGIGKCGLDVFGPEGRIAPKNLVLRRALGKIIENDGHGYAGSARAEIAAANCGIAAQVNLPERHLS